jgi:hypothetical protein
MVIRRQTSKRTRLPRGQGKPRQYRVQIQEDTARLYDWAQREAGLPVGSTFNMALEGKHISYFAKCYT